MNNFNSLIASLSAIFTYPLIVVGKSSITLGIILFNAIIVFTFFFVIAKAKNWMLEALSKKRGFDVNNWRAAITICYYSILFLGIIGILQISGLDLSLFTVLTGAIGIGIGFGMQSIFSNFISGIIILLEKPLKVGDRIEVGSVIGNVQSISVRATTIVTNDNVSIIVPNSDFISNQVINWSHSGKSVRISVPVCVSFDSDTELVRQLLMEIAENEPGVLKGPEPLVRLTEFGENGLQFNLLLWTQDFSDRTGALKSLINFAILKRFREMKIHMPFPQREIHIHHVTESPTGTQLL